MSITRRFAITGAAVVMATAGLAACTSPNSAEGGGDAKTIALLLPESKTTRYESFDRPIFEKTVKKQCPDCTVKYYNADQDEAKQAQQMETAISAGAKVIVLDPVNGPGAGGMVSSAHEAGAKVVAYDRFIKSADYYMSFDNETVGKLQATELVKAMGDKGGYLQLNGAPSDPNAAQFKKGAESVLKKSGLKLLTTTSYDNPDWSPNNAQKYVTDQLSKFSPADVQGVYAANDGQAGGVIAALKGAGVAADALPPVTGQDAELAAIQRIVAGEQEMTVFKSYFIEAAEAGKLAVNLATGKDVGKTTDFEGVKSFIFKPVVVTQDNVQDTIVDSGLYSADDICTKAYAAACEEGWSLLMTVAVESERPVTAPVLSLTGVNKRFGAVQALTDVHLSVMPGEVVALVGDNGAGKSTLVKVIAGVYTPDTGKITFDGRDVAPRGPSQAQALGIATVFQDLALCDNLHVVANLFLGQEHKLGPIIDEVSMEKEAWRLLKSLSAKIPSVRIPIAALSGGQRQTVAIARSLVGSPKIVMLDEPTAALGVAQTAEVLNLIERLRDNGLGVILISHNMADVQAVADRIVVLRLGRNAAEFNVTETSTEEIVAAITGASDNVVTERAERQRFKDRSDD